MGESSLRGFTLDVPTDSVYQFEGEDYRYVAALTSTIEFGINYEIAR